MKMCVMKKIIVLLILLFSVLTVNAQLRFTYSEVLARFNVINLHENSIEIGTETGVAICYFNTNNVCNGMLIEQRNKSKEHIISKLNNDTTLTAGPKYDVDYWILKWIDTVNCYEYNYYVKIVTRPEISNSYFLEYKFYCIWPCNTDK